MTETALNVTWMEPLNGIINSPVMGYNVECTRVDTTGISYKAGGMADIASTYITIPIDVLSSSPSVYNCCVEVLYDTYSSIACDQGRLVIHVV